MRIGVDLGGTKIEVAVLDKGSVICHRERVPTPKGDYAGTVAAIVGLVTRAEAAVGARCSVGVGIPGTLSPDHGCIKNANSVCLIGHNLQADLGAALSREVRLANDADCFALSEASDGAGTGAKSVFGAILGTGAGSGLVVNGQLIAGPNGIAGEWGHNPLPWRKPEDEPSRTCYCGKNNCNEVYLSGTGLNHTLRDFTGRDWSHAEIAHLSDPRALAGLDLYLDQLARGLSHIINIFDPWVIVLGGGVSNLDCLYEEIPKRWGAYVFSDQVNTQLKRNQHGDSSGVRGAAWLWPG